MNRLLVCLFILVFSCSSQDSNTTKTTLVLGVENRLKLVRGWNDITMLIVEKKNSVEVISFPRDTLVYIPAKGWWTLNSMYLVLGVEDMVNWFNHTFKNLHIDNYIVYSIQDIQKLQKEVSSIPLLPSFLQKMLTHYEYIEDWVRHRHKLKAELSRQKRLHAFMEYASLKCKQSIIPDKIFKIIVDACQNYSEEASFKGKYTLSSIYAGFASKWVNYYIWDGYYQKAYFDLKKPDGYTFQQGEKDVYILSHQDSKLLQPYKNSYVFATEDFFQKTVVSDVIPFKSGLYRSFTSWNGGLTLQKDMLVSDNEFTNQNFTLQQVYGFYDLFPKCKLTRDQQKLVYITCKKYKLNFFAVAVQKEKESSLVRNLSEFDYSLRERRALGYACYIIKKDNMGKEFRPFEGYETQIENGIKSMRRRFDEFKPGTEVALRSFEKVIVPKNAATYALYVYTPFYGEAEAFGHRTIGNRRFSELWYILKPSWDKIKEMGASVTPGTLSLAKK